MKVNSSSLLIISARLIVLSVFCLHLSPFLPFMLLVSLWFSFRENSLTVHSRFDIYEPPILCFCLSFADVLLDRLPSFPTPLQSSILHLSLKCCSYLRSPLYPTAPPPHSAFSIAILPQCLFRFACLLLTEVHHSKGASQSQPGSFINQSSLWRTGDPLRF